MAGWGDAAGAILGWFSPEQRAKAKRAKYEVLKNERAELMRGSCTDRSASRVMQIDKELEAIDRDLRS